MKKRAKKRSSATLAPETEVATPDRGMALGYLAMLPLFVAYELALANGTGGVHNTAERILSLPLVVFGERAALARWVVLGLLAIAAMWSLFHHEFGLWRRASRILWFGAFGALVLGPLLLVLHKALGVPEPSALHYDAPTDVPRFAQAMFHFGGAAYEEIVFRVGFQSIGYLLCLELASFYLGAARPARLVAEALSIALSSIVFAAAHLGVFTQILGPGGERFDLSTFAWRFLAGLLLGILFRWRGVGVAAWSHAFFDVALLLGASPKVFL